MQFSVTGPDGEEFSSLTGPATAGLHSVSWNMRGEAPPAAEPGPYEKQQQAVIAERAVVVRDSLVEEGWSELFLDRMVGVFTGDTDRSAMMRMFGGGGGGAGRDPEAFRERPGEQMSGGGGGFNFGQMRELAGLIMPGAGIGSLFRRFGGGRGGGEAPLAEPGQYTLTMTVGERTFTQTLTVERVGELTGDSSPFEEEWEAWLRRLARAERSR